MWFDGQRQPNTIYVANTSRGKDSTAMLRAIQLMGWPLDMICSVDIWFDDDTPAELPPMVAFKDEYDRKVLDWFGVPVTRLCATKDQKRLTYCDIFYRQITPKRERERERGIPTASADREETSESSVGHSRTARGASRISNAQHSRFPKSDVPLVYRGTQERGKTYGFPMGGGKLVYRPQIKGFPLTHQRGGLWCQDRLKQFSGKEKQTVSLSAMPQNEGRKINIVHYIGIAADEPLRIAKHLPKKDKVLPLVQIGWDEDLCGLEAKYMDMLSPTYSDGQFRDGCWFCHNQGVAQLRRLRKMYPNLWAKLMKLDLDSPVTFRADGHTVHDFDRRFALEDDGLVDPAEPWKWTKLDEELNYRWF